jgi:tetratricopeptide (TPR) repeat protein
VTDGYSLREVGKLLKLSRTILCGLIDAGFVSPSRGARREYRFTFADLVVLRAAQGLSEAKVSPSRILRSLRRLRTQLPERIPLSGLRVEAVGDAVVVTDGASQWQPDDGQYVLQFQVEPAGDRLAFLDAPEPARTEEAERWFERGTELESTDVEGACDAYRRALSLDAAHVGAYTNLGRLLHERGRLDDAERLYREGVAACGQDGLLQFNRAVVLEDLGRVREAKDAYRAALDAAPDLADAHYNLALLCQADGSQQEALRHMSAYRRLSGS